MNTERLHVIARAVVDDIEECKLKKRLEQLTNQLQNLVNDPSQPQHQQNVSERLKDISEELKESKSNSFPPTWKQSLNNLGWDGLLGNQLLETLNEIFSRNQITPSIAYEEVNEIKDKINTLESAFSHLIDSFEALGIGADDLNPGECELGVLVPRDFVKNKLEDLGKELHELNKIFDIFSEIATGSRPGFEIREISSSDLSFFLDILPEVAVCMAVSIERIIATYKRILEIRKLRSELNEVGVPKSKTKSIEEHANTMIDDEIEKISSQVLDEYYVGENKRKNELNVELKHALKDIAARIDRGFNIEIRVEPIEENEEEVDEKNGKRKQNINQILESAKTLKYLKGEGDPILCLPESNEKEKEDQ